MYIEEALEQLEKHIREAKTSMFGQGLAVDKSVLLSLVDEAKNALPKELQKARWVIKEQEILLSKAKREAEQIIEDALIERDRLVDDSNIVRHAEREANKRIERAKDEARRIQLQTEDWVEDNLTHLDDTLKAIREHVARGKRYINKGIKEEDQSSIVGQINPVDEIGDDGALQGSHIEEYEQTRLASRHHVGTEETVVVDGLAPTKPRSKPKTPKPTARGRQNVKRRAVSAWDTQNKKSN